jgi:PAS domain S-box-containing protein
MNGDPEVTGPAVFIVEDESIVANDIQDALQHLGYEVTGMARSGETALEKIGEAKPDIILMDIRLAGKMDGIETAAKIRTTRAVPVVYLTANSDTPVLERAKATEPYGYILKPFDERDLKSTIEIALHKFRVDEQVRDREQLIRSLVNTNTEPVFIVDRDTNVLFINDAFVSQRPAMDPGQYRQKLERFAYAGIISGKLVGAILEHFYDEIPYRFSEEFNGKWLAHTIYPLTDAQNRISRCAVYSYDITDIKQRELDLTNLIEQQANKNQSLILYAAMIESMDDIVIVTDVMGYIFYVNRSFVKRFGYSPAEIKKQHIRILQDPADPFAMDTDAFYVDKKKVWNGSFTGLNKHKMRIKTLLKSSPVVYEDQPVCRVFVLRERQG